MFRNFRNVFYDFRLLSEHKIEEEPEEIKPIEPVEDVKMKKEKEEEINTNSNKKNKKKKKIKNHFFLFFLYIIQKFITDYIKIYMMNHMNKVILHKVLNKQMMDMIFLKQKKLIKIRLSSKNCLSKRIIWKNHKIY